MSFRKRNVPLTSNNSRAGSSDEAQITSPKAGAVSTNFPPGVRPSPIDGRPTTSTGVASLDSLLAGHAGLALGNSVLIEENGTTDYAGSILRFYAAEGILQGHRIYVVGMRENWGRELPGAIGTIGDKEEINASIKGGKDKMKIAWRYESLGEAGGVSNARDSVRSVANAETTVPVFCHAYDLTKRLELPSPTAITYIPVSASPKGHPFQKVIEILTKELAHSAPGSIHRVVVPTLLSPALYSNAAHDPSVALQFLHALRALVRQYANRMTAVISLPLSLFPRSMGITRWIELLCDGVIELVPFPHTVDAGPTSSTNGAAGAQDETPQGIVRLHRLPVFHERGGGASGATGIGEDLVFTLSRKRFVIKPFSLPPVGSDTPSHEEAQVGNVKVNIDF